MKRRARVVSFVAALLTLKHDRRGLCAVESAKTVV